MAGPRTVSSAIHVFGVGCFFLAEFFDRHDFELGFGQASEQLRQPGVHLIFVLAVQVEDLFARMGVEFGIGVDGCFETLHVFVAELVHHGEHVCFDFFHLVQAELMNFFGRQIGGGAFFHAEGIPCGAVGEGPCSGLGSALRCVVVVGRRR